MGLPESSQQEQADEQSTITNIKWYEQTWFIVILLIFVTPVGLFIMWRSAKFNIYVKGIATVLVIAMVLFASSESDKATMSKNTSEQTTPDKTKNEQLVTNNEEDLNLGITVEEFKTAFNKKAVERNVPQLELTNIQYFDDEKNFVQQYPAGLYLFGKVDKGTGFLKEVVIMKEFLLKESEHKSEFELAVITFYVTVAALNPELSFNDYGEILNKLWEKSKNSSVVIGNKEYSSLLFDKGKLMSLGIKAKVK